MLSFRDQAIDRAAHRDFALRWGALEQHPFFKYIQPGQTAVNVATLAKDAQTSAAENIWHNDLT